MSFKQLAQRTRFWLGYCASSLTEWMLAEGRTPPVRWIPWGLSWCYDLRRCFASAGKTPRMLFDVGANIGQTALHLHTHFPQATIHAFEPVPQTFEMLQKNISEKKHIIACDFALGSENITQHISLFDDSEFNTLKPDPQQTNRKPVGSVEIQIKKLDDYRMTKNIQSVDLLKMDVQGYELEVLEGAKNSLSQNQIGAVYSEVCFKTLSSEIAYFNDLQAKLLSMNFHFIGLYEHYRHGKFKEFHLFCNALWVNWDYIYRPSTQGSAG